jgi:two-component system, chemotaxis family, protein-glutamate methylesterase/glutaminase
MNACVASDGQLILPGNIYIAPGDRHLTVERDGARYICRLNDGPPVNRHKPSVEVLFQSVADNVGKNAIGVMLTGMGADGAKAMLSMREAGAINIAQDEASSVVWGMPGEAYKQGAVHHLLPLDSIAAQILALNNLN